MLLAPADVAAFRRLALLQQFAVGKPRARKLSGTYFDTPELRLKEHCMALRVRRAGRIWTQTLKAGGHAMAGWHQRQEWETQVDGPQPDLAALAALVGPSSDWAKVLAAPGLAPGLAPIFDCVFLRTVWTLHLAHGTAVELALDQGEVQRGDARDPISEIDSSSRPATQPRCSTSRCSCKTRCPCASATSASRPAAMRCGHRKPMAAVKAGCVELASQMTVEQGFRAIVSHCVAQMQDNESGVAGRTDPQSVHQMRVGMRRLRSALGLFTESMPFPEVLQSETRLAGG